MNTVVAINIKIVLFRKVVNSFNIILYTYVNEKILKFDERNVLFVKFNIFPPRVVVRVLRIVFKM